MRRFFNQENVIQNNGGGKLPEKDFSLEEIGEELKDRGENWQKRVNMMKQMPNLLAQLDEISYGAIFANVAKCLIIQLQDRRTTIVPVASDCLCKIFGDPEKLHISLHSLAEIVQSGLFQCIRTKIKIIHDSGVKASIELATELPLDQDDHALRAFVTGTKEKHGQVRKTCFDCIGRTGKEEQTRIHGYISFSVPQETKKFEPGYGKEAKKEADECDGSETGNDETCTISILKFNAASSSFIAYPLS